MNWRKIYNIPNDMGLIPENWPDWTDHPADDLCYYIYKYMTLQSVFDLDIYTMKQPPENLAMIVELGDMFIQ